MPVSVRWFTDPACPASWAAEPLLRKLMVEFGADLSFRWVMGGLARQVEGDPAARVREWLDSSERSGMPLDPRIWLEGPIASSYPACMAVKAAAEQGEDAAGGYLRALREGLFCFRRKLDTTEALVEQARGSALDVQRFRVDLGSHAILEAFGADLELTREAGVSLPSVGFGEDHPVAVPLRYEELRQAAVAAGAGPVDGAALDVPGALSRFGRMATAEVEAVCELPGPRASAELWRLASEWRVRPVRVLTGMLWEPAA